MHTHCPTCHHCTDLHRVSAELVVCLACHVEGRLCPVIEQPVKLRLLLAAIFAQNVHESHEAHGV